MPSDQPLASDLASLRRLWTLAGLLRGQLARAVLFRCLQSMFLGLAYLAAIQLVTALIAGQQITVGLAVRATALAAASLAGQLLLSFLSVSLSWDASFQTGGRLRLRLQDHLRDLPMGFHLSRHSGDTATVMTTDVAMIEGFLSDALAKIVQAIVMPLMLIVFIAWQAPLLALVLPFSLFVAMPLAILIGRKFSGIALERQDLQARAGSVMIEYVQGIRVIRAFNQIDAGQRNFRAALDRFRDMSVRMVLLLAFPMVSFAAALMLGVPLVAVATGLWLGQGDQGVLITALMLVFSVYAPLVGLAALMERVRIADASLQRLERVLGARPLPMRGVQRPAGNPVIRFEDVNFSYGKDEVLAGISFSAAPGSMTAIVGPSGSGKTTILNLLARFWDVTGGAITIGGADLRAIPAEELSGMISVVFQDVHLFSGTIRDNITAGHAGITQKRIEAAAKAAQAHDFIAALPQGYDTLLGEGGARLSGGERQRIAIARAILKDAPIILLDEATAALDPTNERAIQQALAALVARKTLIVVAHKLSTIEAADRILVLDNGRIAESGTHDELIARPGLYARMHAKKSSAGTWRIVPDKSENMI